MRNHIAFKCIAVLLCAVSLLGSIGSGLGILALTEMGLYNKTMDQFLEERIQGEGSYLARNIATRYASMELGGIPEEIAWQYYPNYSGVLNTYGYTLKDADGKVLDSIELEGSVVQTYTFPVDSQYMHLVAKFREPTT